MTDCKSIRQIIESSSGSTTAEKSTPSFFKSLADGGELLLSIFFITTSLLVLFIGVINGSYTLCSCSVCLFEEQLHCQSPALRDNVKFIAYNCKEKELATVLDGEAFDFNIYDKTRLLLICASVIAAGHLLGINGILLDAMVHLAAVAEIKHGLVYASLLSTGIAISVERGALKDVIKLFSSLTLEIALIDNAISTCDCLKSDCALLILSFTGCITFTVCSIAFGIHKICCSETSNLEVTLPTSTNATLFLHRSVGDICTVFVDLSLTWREVLDKVNFSHSLTIAPSTRITWCGKTLRSDIPLLEYGIHNLSTLFIEDIGLKGGTGDWDDVHRDDDSDTDRRVSLRSLRMVHFSMMHFATKWETLALRSCSRSKPTWEAFIF